MKAEVKPAVVHKPTRRRSSCRTPQCVQQALEILELVEADSDSNGMNYS